MDKDMKNLFLNYENIEDLKLEKKSFDKYKLDIVKYNKDFSDLTDPLTRKCRSVVIDQTNMKIKAISPYKSYDVNEETIPILKKNWNELIVENFIDGSLINLYYHNDKWIISTKSWIGGDNNWLSFKTFGLMFEEAFKKCNMSYDMLNKSYSYSFVLQHPDNRIVCKYFEPKLTLIHVVQFYENNSYKILDYRDIGKKLYMDVPEIVLFETYEDMISEIKKLKFFQQGFVMKFNNKRYKLQNPLYKEVKEVRGNVQNIRLRYIQLRSENKVKEFLRYYNEYANECKGTKRSIHNLTSDLFYHYCNYYIKRNPSYIIPREFINMCSELHNCYRMKKLLYNSINSKNSPRTTYTDCINFVNQLEPEVILNKITRLYYE